ncbi:hypothetical protein [Amycolatopsis viridis]|uniref:Uncharacterized protein n=1 Tax=Amycolatopsis viridis TaxID=185678 RepID=A0ABX0T507_9PSEU|nr:hypothetical protein [Amycolatopsis viridis]NIH82670.1 hypothetical protein [Amycolatopsis viridis]
MSVPGPPAVRPPAPSGRQGSRVAGAVLALLCAAAAVTGSFLPLFQGSLLFQGETQLTIAATGWGLSAEAVRPGAPAGTVGSPVRNGYPLAVAGLLLLVAAVVGLAAAGRVSPPGRKFAAALLTAVGSAFLVATALGIALQGVSLHESFRPTGAAAGISDFGTADSFGLGFWLVGGAAVASIVAAVLAALQGRRAPRYDVTTPRYGVPAPQGYQPPFAAPPQWPTVDPNRRGPQPPGGGGYQPYQPSPGFPRGDR